jgi:ribosomal-protein-alanine N-acetyltransferase
MKLETKRLILRTPETTDVDDYLEFCNSEFVLRYNAMTPRTAEQMQRRFSEGQADTLVIEHKKDGKVIGEISIEDDSVRWGVESKELSYFIHEAYSRQGYMKEALQAVIDYLFTQEKVECVSARCFAPNEASLALLKSLGFHQDGYIPQCVKGYKDQIFDDTLHSLFRNTPM